MTQPTYQPQPFQPEPTGPPPVRPPVPSIMTALGGRRMILVAIVAAVFLLIGAVAGATMNTTSTTAPSAAPTATVTATATATETITETPSDQPTATTPQACLDALDDADKAFHITSDAFNVIGMILDAAGRFDTSAMNAGTAKLNKINKKITPVLRRYATARDDCRSS